MSKKGRAALIRWAARNVLPRNVEPPLVWTYSGSCPYCGWIIRADLPLLLSRKEPTDG